MEHEIKKDAPSAQQAAGSIDTPEFWALLNERDEGAMDDAHATELEQAIIAHIDAWAAATPAQPIATQELTADLIHLLNAIRPNFGDVGTRDIDVAQQRQRIDRAIIQLGLIAAHDGREHPTTRPVAQPIAVSAPTDGMPTMRAAFRTEHSGSDGYWMKFKFRSLDELQQASKEWRAARAAAPVSGPTDAPDGFIFTGIVGSTQTKLVCKEIETARKLRVAGDIVPYWTAPAAPVSGQGASIGDDGQFLHRLQTWRIAISDGAKQSALIDLIAYIDSRPRSEDSRAEVLEEAAQACESRCYAGSNNAAHADAEARACAEDIRALATSAAPVQPSYSQQAVMAAILTDREDRAAPERSGKLADETVWSYEYLNGGDGWTTCYSADEPVMDEWKRNLVKFTRTAPEANSSSAAPIALSKQLRSVYAAYNGHGEELKGICDQAADELDRLAAPSPTRESLNEKPCVGCNGAGVIGTPGMPCPFCPVEKKLREFEAALATPRQTEDGGLSAALAEEVADVLMSQNWRGDLVERLRDVAASTFAPKETAVQGGVPEAEPVAWIRKTDITELTDSEPETNGWTPLYAAPTGASK